MVTPTTPFKWVKLLVSPAMLAMWAGMVESVMLMIYTPVSISIRWLWVTTAYVPPDISAMAIVPVL